MTRILYVDASAGVSGDMFVGALVDSGASMDVIRDHIECLGVAGIQVSAKKVKRRGLVGTKFDVLDPDSHAPVDAHDDTHFHHGHRAHHRIHGHDHRGLKEIRRILGRSALPPNVAEDALAVFELLGRAEAKVHGVSPEEVHFHEVGALDAIADIVAAASGFHQLGIDEAWCSPVHVGSGTVRCAHGVLPVPAPATMEILKGTPIYSADVEGELATPTGAALVRHFCKGFGPMPSMVVESVGYGAGSKDLGIPNLLRVTVGTISQKVAPIQLALLG